MNTAKPNPWPLRLVRLAGSGLLAATGAIHLDLYVTGYRTIPTIGWMFAMQFVVAFVLAIVIAVSARWIFAAAGALFAGSTLFGYLLSVTAGLFGFKEVRTTAGIVAGVLEVAAVVVLTSYVVAIWRRNPAQRPLGRGQARRVDVAIVSVASGLAVLTFLLAAAAAAGAPPEVAGGHVRFGTRQINGTTVLTNAQGLTLYWFAPDTPTMSKCTGACTAYWPPVVGAPETNAAIPGTFATIERSNGVLQVTYDGHPLYTYIGDSQPGQATGNDVDLNGGYWFEVTVKA